MTETRLKGVYRAIDFADDVQNDWAKGITPGMSAGWYSLDFHYLVKLRQWTVVTGIPGHGKSTWLDNVMVNLSKLHGWKHLVCSPENQPIQRHVESLIEIYAGKKFTRPELETFPERAITPQELAEAYEFINSHFQFIAPDETDFNIDYILALAKELKETMFNFQGFVLDPYNELEHHRPPQMSETEYISSVLSKWRRFARGNDTHNWLVAHPTKLRELSQMQTEEEAKKLKIYAMPSLYDIAGSANWRNKADMGVVVYRNINQKPETTTVSVQKVRFRECGSIGQAEFFYDFLCNRFVEREGELLFERLKRGDA